MKNRTLDFTAIEAVMGIVFVAVLFVFMSLFLGCSSASAAQDLTTVTIDFTAIEAVMGIVFIAALAMFGYRKFIKTANRT